MNNEVTQAVNPATGEIIEQVRLNTTDELCDLIAKARKAQELWMNTDIKERSRIVLKIRDYLVNNMDKIARTISRDNGKTITDSLATEVISAIMAVSYYCKNAERFLKDQKLAAGNILFIYKRSKIVKIPYGVIGIISPWNYPFSIPFSEVVMGLLAGNAVFLKVATETQAVGLALKEAIEYAGLPPNIFNYINLPGRIVGDAFLAYGIDKIFFTGSVSVGKYLMEKAAKTLTPLCLELGGNDAMIVCEDADLSRAASGALWAGFQNAGQSCGGIERIYVHEKVYKKFIELLKTLIQNLHVGYGENYDSGMGCMTTTKQYETVKKQVEDAVNKGAVIFAQSEVPKEQNLRNFLPAMILTEVDHGMTVMRDETFGPVVGVMKFETEDEAIKLANDSYLGLTGSVWTQNRKKAERIGRRIKAGVVTVNDHLMSHGLPETPWGGFKQSGIGRTHGKLGFDEMTQSLTLVNDILPFQKRNLWWHPFNKKLYDGLKGIPIFLYGNKLSLKLKGLISLLKVIKRIFQRN